MGDQKRILHTALWVLPVTTPPIYNGAVLVAGNIIERVGPAEGLKKVFPARVVDHGRAVLFPGLVNAHTHLEFSALKGKIDKCDSFPQWLKRMAWRRLLLGQDTIRESARRGVEELVNSGTALVGDVSNLIDTASLMVGRPIKGIIFHELISLRGDRAEEVMRSRIEMVRGYAHPKDVVHTISPHAPYSVSPELFRLIKGYCRDKGRVTSVHLAESPEEAELCLKGGGALKELLERAGLWEKDWKVPKVSPVRYLEGLGFLDERTMAVHLTQATPEDVAILKGRGVSICLSVRSNEMTGVGQPPIKLFLEAGLNMCLGTDSLASNEDLSILNEMRALKKFHPYLDEAVILRMATINGARALGFDDRLGSLELGKEAFILSLPIPTPEDPFQALFAPGQMPRRVFP